MHQEIIQLEGITKYYSNKIILKNINLSISRGKAITFMGNNGCGKSTLLKVISGLTKYNSGKLIYSNKLKINYIPEHFPKLNINVKQYIECMGKIENIPTKELKLRSEKLFYDFSIESMVDTPLKHLSKGSLQKVAVIQALLKKADVLLLDEPLSGQDIRSQNFFIKYIKKLKNEGTAIAMSCHEMFLVNQLSDQTYKIHNGELTSYEAKIISLEELNILHFDNHSSKRVSEELIKYFKKIEYSNSEIIIIAERDKCNVILRKMMDEGYLLQSMRNMKE